jgi:hypothetical protein
MPKFSISVINSEFAVSNEHDHSTFDAAREEAIRGALQIGTDEIISGKGFFGAEVVIEEGSQVVDRFVVAIGSSPLQ